MVCSQRRVALFFLSEIKLHKFSQDDRGALIQTSHRDSTKSRRKFSTPGVIVSFSLEPRHRYLVYTI